MLLFITVYPAATSWAMHAQAQRVIKNGMGEASVSFGHQPIQHPLVCEPVTPRRGRELSVLRRPLQNRPRSEQNGRALFSSGRLSLAQLELDLVLQQQQHAVALPVPGRARRQAGCYRRSGPLASRFRRRRQTGQSRGPPPGTAQLTLTAPVSGGRHDDRVRMRSLPP
jgi:hypothetical protein